ncbi:MAG: hypothetical protein R2939_21715 [Kofleriaceae bacterium]
MLALGWLAACLPSTGARCDDGSVCPAGTECHPRGCLDPAQLTACAGKDEGATCEAGSLVAGTCVDGACLQAVCGNGVQEPGEACDDGNELSGDGCAGSCRSLEVCGNGVTDFAVAEACDCGDDPTDLPAGCLAPNGTDPGATCRPDCQLSGCGDGIIAGSEQCEPELVVAASCGDRGYYGGELGCAANCQFDTSACVGRCGDGERQGPESCDGDVGATTCAELGFAFGRPTCSSLCGFDISSCESIGWTQVRAEAAPILAMADGPDGDLWITADDDVRRYDGLDWTAYDDVGAGASLRAITVTADGEVVAAGAAGTVAVFDGVAWSRAPAVPGAATLSSVWAATSDEIYVGSSAGAGGLWYFDGVSWASVTGAGATRALAGVSASEVFAVAGNGRVYRLAGTTTPALVDAGGGNRPSGARSLVAFAGDALWVIGDDGLWSWDGAAWTSHHADTGVGLVGTSPRALLTRSQSGGLGRWDGRIWIDVDLPTGLVDPEVGVAGGGAYVAAGPLLYRATRAWGTARPLATTRGLRIWASDDAVWLSGAPAGPGVSVATRNGVAVPGIDSFTSIWELPDRTLVGTGTDLTIRPVVGVTTTYAGIGRTAIWSAAPGATFVATGAATSPGAFANGSGVALTGVDDSAGPWASTWASSATDVWFAGDSAAHGQLAHWDGAAWTDFTLDGDATGVQVWGSASDDVFALDSDGVIYRFDGAAWDVSRSASPGKVIALHGSAADNVFALHDYQRISHFDGESWRDLPRPDGAALGSGLWVEADQLLLSSSAGGVRALMRLAP